MSDLDYSRIAEILGGNVTTIEPPVFGGMSAGGAGAERFRLLHDTYRRVRLSADDVKKIVAAFEETRDGHEVDRVLVDSELCARFHARCREFGVTASEAVINKRLQAVRKSGPHGLRFRPSTKASGIDGERYTYVAEMAFSQLTYRPDVSEDDVLTDPKVGDEFARIAHAIDPKAPLMAVKWALVSLRKYRGSLNEKRITRILALRPARIARKFENAGSLSVLHLSSIPEAEGVFCLHEDTPNVDRYLYLASAQNIRKSVSPFSGARPFNAIANPFWTPDAKAISLRYAVITRRPSAASANDWYFRLVQVWRPVFNIPVDFDRRAA